MRLHPFAALAALALAAGCATTPRPGADVTRFHLNAPIARAAVFVEPADAAETQGLAYRQYADTVAARLASAGFTPVPNRADAELLAVVSYARSTREGLTSGRGSGVTVGVGAGGGGGGFGLGGGISIPIGKKRRATDTAVDTLSLALRRKSDQSTIWEGRAVTEAAADTGPAATVPLLADALLADFPGPSGATTRYPPRRR